MHELIVIGGGPGGCAAALRAAQGGLSVALFEPRQVGGTCLNRGCVPTKALLHGAGPGCDWPALAAEVERVVSTLRAGQEKQLRAAGVELIPYRAVVTGPHTVEAGGAAYEAAHILVAAGSEPALPPIPGLDTPGVVTSDGLLSDLRPLDRLAIIGGGVIGCEMAAVFSHYGSSVTVIEAESRILPQMDAELSEALSDSFRKQKVEILTSHAVEKITRSGSRSVICCAGGKAVEADKILLSIGRVSDLNCLGALKDRISQERGKVIVDEYMKTNIPNIYAAGDINGKSMLAHSALRWEKRPLRITMGGM